MTRSENERGERADCTKKKSLAWEDGWMGREKEEVAARRKGGGFKPLEK
jgi:hypothetical protein